ncbi:hypothetical protein HPB50_019494 [Hyalomma asiaticum]|uniref:Uncharacterized protein n=1 Tax=Hyalomma asiaticum TaxID=266040 RepID=A0ACB7T6B4_HYAAI|nr:hypothetical protein HPB50_019494 [Hyalomma asiaticum]
MKFGLVRESADLAIPAVREEQQHVAFLTPSNQTAAPARDVLRLLKTNIDPASKAITDVTLRLIQELQKTNDAAATDARANVSQDLHVPTCTFCATYGHGRTTCPHKTDPMG